MGISFTVHDCVYFEKDFYTINSITVRHMENKIIVNFLKKDVIAGINISLLKYSEIDTEDKSITLDNVEISEYEELELLEFAYKYENIDIIISGEGYNFLKEKQIIAYFDTNYEYDGHYLNKILNKVEFF
jgi:hypothetical protein